MTYLDKLEFVFKHYGIENQKQKIVEECNELIQAIQNNDEENMLEEMADVLNVICQFGLIPEYKEKITNIRDFKIDRQVERIRSKGVENG